MTDLMLTYDTVYLKPKFSTLTSRSDAITTVMFLDRLFRLPVVPANMEDVISFDNAKYLAANGYFYIMHRFNNATPKFIVHANNEKFDYVSVSIGVKDYADELDIAILKNLKVNFITIDVAHAHHENVKPVVKWVRKYFPQTKLIAGNVATVEGASYLQALGVDALKVGIGGGSICTTKSKTGFHVPTLESVFNIRSHVNLPIIADGGIKEIGDIAKALRFGANMVMAGQLFAACIDSPAKIQHGKKIYRGSTSYEMKGKHKNIEGRTLEIEQEFTYDERIQEIMQALQSSISYAGGSEIRDLRHVDYGRVFPK